METLQTLFTVVVMQQAAIRSLFATHPDKAALAKHFSGTIEAVQEDWLQRPVSDADQQTAIAWGNALLDETRRSK